MPCRPKQRRSLRQFGYEMALKDQVWCPDCAVRIYTLGARLRDLPLVKCRVCGQQFENPAFGS